MLAILGLLVLGVTPLLAAPLYGEQGGYAGYASYSPLKNHIQSSVNNQEDSIRASAGSPDVSRTLSKDNSQEDYTDPKSYEDLSYKPASQHGYGGNSLGEGVEAAPYAKATLYGDKSGGYKLSDAYQNQNIQLNAEKHHDYKDDYVHPPQPYEFGYALKDAHGNTQHRQESSDGHGKVEGSYGFTDEHGLYRTVQYVADKGGFRAEIKTNEPGTENQDPADVHVDSEQAKH